MEGKVFRLTLVNTDRFEQVRDYLKKLKHFQYGLAVFTQTERGFDVIYILVKYSFNKTLNQDKLHHCRIRKGPINIDTMVKHYKEVGEEIWEQGAYEAMRVDKKQKKIEDYMVSHEISAYIK